MESTSTESSLPEVCGGDPANEEEVKLVEAVKEALCHQKLQEDENESEECMPNSGSEDTSSSTKADEQIETTCVAGGIIETVEKDTEPKRLLTCDKGHLLAIDSEFLSNILKEFVERYEFVKKEEALSGREKAMKEKLTVSRNITEKDITEFWERYRTIFSEDRERLWDNLLVGLKKYYEILKERHQLNAETESLRKQNAEMHRLLSRQ